MVTPLTMTWKDRWVMWRRYLHSGQHHQSRWLYSSHVHADKLTFVNSIDYEITIHSIHHQYHCVNHPVIEGTVRVLFQGSPSHVKSSSAVAVNCIRDTREVLWETRQWERRRLNRGKVKEETLRERERDEKLQLSEWVIYNSSYRCLPSLPLFHFSPDVSHFLCAS